MTVFDFAQANEFASALGKTPETLRFRGFFHRDNPRKAGDPGKKSGSDRRALVDWQSDGRGVYMVINDGGDKDNEITDCCAFFVEWDDRDKEWQKTAWQELNLPEPTLQIDTGGKSIHNYWVLSPKIPPEQWREIQTRLLEYSGGDRTLKNPSRVMRLPGFYHTDGEGLLGSMVQLIHSKPNLYTAEQFAAYLPEPEVIEHQINARSYTENDSHTLDEIRDAIRCIPAAVPKSKQYPFFRNLLWGLIAACEEAGGSADDALAIMQAHSPLFREAPQVARSAHDHVGAGTFWYHAKQGGYRRLAPKSKPAKSKPSAADPPKPPEPPRARGHLPADLPFRALGFDRDRMFYMSNTGGQVIEISAQSHTKNKLMLLADITLWRRYYQKESGAIDWDSAANDMMRECLSKNVFDHDKIRGRGAWFDDGRVIFHVGDRLYVDGQPVDVLKFDDSDYFYENSRRMDGPGDEPLSDIEAQAIYSIAERFSWDVPANAHLLLGWIALAPVCGACDWRPHVWLSGGAGTGKSTILAKFMRPLLGGIYLPATGGTTEAGLRGMLNSDAIPVVFDEFEKNNKNDKVIVQNVLTLARIASSEGGKVFKGVAGGGGANAYSIKSMFCVSSINVSLVEKADIDRFCVLGLKRDDDRDRAQWSEFDREITATCTTGIGRKLVARTLSRISVIRFNAITLASALAKSHGQRFGDQHGWLLAGAWSLYSPENTLLTIQQAEEWIGTMDWTERLNNTEADELRCRDAIYQSTVRIGHEDYTIGEAIVSVSKYRPLGTFASCEDAARVLARYGIRIYLIGSKLPGNDIATENLVAIATSNKLLKGILADTPWSDGSHSASLTRIKGAIKPDNAIHFSGVGLSRAILVPLETEEGL